MPAQGNTRETRQSDARHTWKGLLRGGLEAHRRISDIVAVKDSFHISRLLWGDWLCEPDISIAGVLADVKKMQVTVQTL